MQSSTSEQNLPVVRCKLACEECRERKRRCDGQRPQCGACSEAGALCIVDTKRSTRGPKKGLLKALKIQATELRQRLADRENGHAPHDRQVKADRCTADMATVSDTGVNSEIHSNITSKNAPIDNQSQAIKLIPELTHLIQIDLNQLYFERVHPSAPFMQKRRFVSCDRQLNPTRSQLCLNLSMWATAARRSPQYHNISNSIYRQAREALENLELDSRGLQSVNVEQVQSWILLALYETMHMQYQSAWMSIGRACRYIHILGLHKVDSPENTAKAIEDGIKIEEERRTFWMVYCLDRLVGMRYSWPVAFNELAICTRLPIPEDHFQAGQSSQGSFLSEEISADSIVNAPSFTEVIVIVTICGRCLSHKQQSIVEPIYGSASQEYWDRHEWLDSLLMKRLGGSFSQPMLDETFVDPMGLFARFAACTTMIYLSNVPESLPWETLKHPMVAECYHKKRMSAIEIVRLTQYLDEVGILKVHPLTPYPVYSAAEALLHQNDPIASYDEPLMQKLVSALNKLRPVSDSVDYFLKLLEPGLADAE